MATRRQWNARNLWAALVLLLGVMLCARSARADMIYDNRSRAGDTFAECGEYDVSDASEKRKCALGFNSGWSDALTDVSVALSRNRYIAHDARVYFELWTVSTTSPGQLVASIGSLPYSSVPVDRAWVTFSGLKIPVAPNTDYFIYVRSSGWVAAPWSRKLYWYLATTGPEAALRVSADRGVTWSAAAGKGVALISAHPIPVAIGSESGSVQTALVGTAFALPLVTTVRDSNGQPVPGVKVTFQVPSQEPTGVLSVVEALTDTNGHATTTVVAGKQTGALAVTASVRGATAGGITTLTTTFALANAPGPVAWLRVDPSSTDQSAQVHTDFTNPLRVTLRDAFGNATPDINVTYEQPGGDYVQLSQAAARTDALGIAYVNAHAQTSTGRYVVGVTGAGQRGSFELANTSDAPRHITAVVTSLTSTVGTYFPTLQFDVKDAAGLGVPGVLVDFDVVPAENGASGQLEQAASRTDSSGRVQVRVRANTVSGLYQVKAMVDGVSQAALVAMRNVAGPAVTCDTTGSDQSAVVATAFVFPLAVIVKDQYNNGVTDVVLPWTPPATGPTAVLSASSTNTDLTGTARVTAVAGAAAGTYVVAVTTPCGAYRFALTNQAGPAARIDVTSGQGQTAAVATAFASLIEVTVRDIQGNAIRGVQVAFTAPNPSGASAVMDPISGESDDRGIVATRATANTHAGTYDVFASAAGVIPALVTLHNTAASPVALTASQSSTPQTARVGLDFSPLGARLTDIYGNGVAGTSVSFQPPADINYVVLGSSSSTTDLAGFVEMSARAGSSTATYVVTASAGALQTAYNLTNISGAAGSITAENPTLSTTVTKVLGPLRVVVKDSGGNPSVGAMVHFLAPSAGPSAALKVLSVRTDAVGHAEVPGTANTVAGNYRIEASADGVAASAFFNVTNVGDIPAKVFPGAGSTPQSAPVGATFAEPLVLRVQDRYNNGVAGVTVAFTSSASGAGCRFAISEVVTDAEGRATVQATANLVVGTYTVSGTIGTLAGTFALRNTPTQAAQIFISAGNAQSIGVGEAFPEALEVLVLDTFTNPAPNVKVTFEVPSAGPSAVLSTAQVTTNDQGKASVTATANGIRGGYSVGAFAQGIAQPARFLLTNTTGPAARLEPSGGSTPQATRIETEFPNPLAAVVTDRYGNPVSGLTVRYTVPSSGASAVLTASSSVSDVAGRVNVHGTASSTSGSYLVSAVVDNVPTASTTFALNNLSGNSRYISAQTGPQTATVSSSFDLSLRVQVKDSSGNPAEGVTVTFLVPKTGASVLLNLLTINTDSQGLAEVRASANRVAGSYTVLATVEEGADAASFALKNAPDSAQRLVLDPTGSQSTAIRTQFPKPLAVVVLDRFDNPVPQVAVTFTSSSSGAGAHLGATEGRTDQAGKIEVLATANAIAGDHRVRATVGSLPGDFALTNLAGTADSIKVVSGNAQSARVTSAFTLPFVVEVRDSGGNAIQGVSIDFASPGTEPTASLSARRATTGADGRAQVTGTAASRTGTYEVVATLGGPYGPSAHFSLRNDAGVPARLIAKGVAARQSAKVGTRFGQPLLVTLLDAQGNRVPGATVSFGAPASGASAVLSQATAVTGAEGEATVTVQANSTAGRYAVTASVSGIAAAFNLANLASDPYLLEATLGASQRAEVGTAYALPLEATLRTSSGTVVGGASLSFSVYSLDGSSVALGSASSTTDSSGKAQTSATANEVTGSLEVLGWSEGASEPASFALLNAPRTTTTTLTVTPMSSRPGTSLSVTITVTARGGVPSGTVRLWRGAVPWNMGTLSNGVHTMTVDTLEWGTGTFPLTASYDGDDMNEASASDTVQVVLSDETDAGVDAGPDASGGDAAADATFDARADSPADSTAVLDAPSDSTADSALARDAGKDAGPSPSNSDSGGCRAAGGPSSRVSLVLSVLALAAATLRRRRSRS
jgi:hypothetical protein